MGIGEASEIVKTVIVEFVGRGAQNALRARSAVLGIPGNRVQLSFRVIVYSRILLEVHACCDRAFAFGRCRIGTVPGGEKHGGAD